MSSTFPYFVFSVELFLYTGGDVLVLSYNNFHSPLIVINVNTCLKISSILKQQILAHLWEAFCQQLA